MSTGARPSIEAQKATLNGAITQIRVQQKAYETQLEEAVATEVRALALLDSSRALQHYCREHACECAAAISSIQDEIAALIPEQP